MIVKFLKTIKTSYVDSSLRDPVYREKRAVVVENWRAGDVGEVLDAIGAELIAAGHAVADAGPAGVARSREVVWKSTGIGIYVK